MGNKYSNVVPLSEAGSEEQWENVSESDCYEDDNEVLLDDEGKFKFLNESKDAFS